MTTEFPQEVVCAVCGLQQVVHELGSTNAFGPMDLDTRPPEMQRSTMSLWVHECRGCGYVAEDLGKASEHEIAAMAAAGYRQELKRKSLASQFVCRSMLDEAAGDLVAAGWRRLHAAWVCDDGDQDGKASSLRIESIGLFERAVEFCDAGKSEELAPFLRQLLDLEVRLCADGDRGCHTVAEAE